MITNAEEVGSPVLIGARPKYPAVFLSAFLNLCTVGRVAASPHAHIYAHIYYAPHILLWEPGTEVYSLEVISYYNPIYMSECG